MASNSGGNTPTPKINYDILRSSAALLNMEYKPSELARQLRVNVKTVIRSYVPSGLPHRRDQGGNIWIVGIKFDEWARTIYNQRIQEKHPAMREDQAWCVRCRRIVDYAEVLDRRPMSQGRVILRATCPHCKKPVVRFLKGGRHDRA